ncbi:MAG: glycosyltransferase family A protein [Chitinivibrionales bacterium]|nr:glycosyltransferase family A protein [Chitinivibrionales bacterium]
MPPVSIIIPTYNRARLLGRALDSVFAQDFSDYEIIVVDDGSTDDTTALPQLADGRVRLLRLSCNCGVACARNHGVAAAAGRLIAFLDSDDAWLPQKLSRQTAWLLKNPGFRIMQTGEIWIRNGARVNPPATHKKIHGDIFASSLERCMVTPSSALLEKELFLEMGGFNECLRACEDYDLWLKIACRYPIGLLDENLLVRYGGHADQLSGTTFALDRFRVRSLLDLLTCGALSAERRKLTKDILAKKAGILAQGFKKHANHKEYRHYAQIANAYAL